MNDTTKPTGTAKGSRREDDILDLSQPEDEAENILEPDDGFASLFEEAVAAPSRDAADPGDGSTPEDLDLFSGEDDDLSVEPAPGSPGGNGGVADTEGGADDDWDMLFSEEAGLETGVWPEEPSAAEDAGVLSAEDGAPQGADASAFGADDADDLVFDEDASPVEEASAEPAMGSGMEQADGPSRPAQIEDDPDATIVPEVPIVNRPGDDLAAADGSPDEAPPPAAEPAVVAAMRDEGPPYAEAGADAVQEPETIPLLTEDERGHAPPGQVAGLYQARNAGDAAREEPDTDEDETVAAAMNGPATSAAAPSALVPPEPAPPPLSRPPSRLPLVAVALGLLATGAAGLALWQVAQVPEQTPASGALPAAVEPPPRDDARIDALAARIGGLEEQVGAQQALLEQVQREPPPREEPRLDELDARLSEMSEALAGLRAELEKVQAAPTARAIDPPPGAGPATWLVNLSSFREERLANKELARLGKVGIEAGKRRVESKGRTLYRVSVGGFPDYAAAKAYANAVQAKAGITTAWPEKTPPAP